MVVRLSAKGLEDCTKVLDKVFEGPPNVYVLFVGSNDPMTGKSWCPDCVGAEPVIEKAIQESAPEDAIVINVEVGDRPTWKDPKNPFRSDSRFLLTSVPTLMQYGTSKRLDSLHLTHLDTVKMLFEDATSESKKPSTDK